MAMEKTERKYTLAEAVVGLGLLGVGTPVVLAIVIIPIMLAESWARTLVWNWFCHAFELPPVSIWAMFAAGLFVGLWRSGARELKEEFYKAKALENFGAALLVQAVGLGVAWLLHLWWRP